MLGPFAPDGLRVEIALTFQATFIEQILGPVSQRPAQPRIKGNSEADLGSLEQFGRHIAGEERPQDAFSFPIAHLVRVRQRPRELDHAMVEQGRARFERHGHAGAINLCQDVVG